MKLNTLAGRTYNDLSQYPVFPWVLSDYESSKIDLSDPRIYRDLRKPVGALDEKRKRLVEERYQLALSTDDPASAFHYGSHYSTAGIVLYYLIRLEPFTFLHTAMQGGKIDHADRLFSSVKETWSNCNSSSADFKELIPEFFYMPEMFQNVNDVDFGVRQNGNNIIDVELPPWANGSRFQFVKFHREALESEFVSANLHSWVDLIFGFKQRGKAAVEAVNCFHYLSYEGNVSLSAIEDEHERKAVTDHILHFGQTPSQLFRRKHPQRSSPFESSIWSDDTLQAKVKYIAGRAKRMIQYSCFAGNRVILVDEAACTHYYRWIAPRSDFSAFTFASPSNSGLSLEYEKSNENLKPHFQSRNTDTNNLFLILTRRRAFVSFGHWDNSVRCYDLDDMQCIQCLSFHKDRITCAAADPQEKMVVTGSRDTTLIVWQVVDSPKGSGKSGQLPVLKANPVHILYGHKDEITAITLSVSLDIVVSASAGGNVIFHTLQNGEYVRQCNLPNQAVPKSLALSKDGMLVIYCGQDLLLYSMTINATLVAAVDIDERVNSFAFTSDNQHIILGGEKGNVSIRQVHDLKLKGKHTGKGVAIRSVMVTPEDCVIAGSQTGDIAVIAPDNTQQQRTNRSSRSWSLY